MSLVSVAPSLTLDSSNNETAETVWNNNNGADGASGGGTSGFFKRPSWQAGTGVASGTMRLVPDIACSADPNRGADTVFEGATQVVGGTSWATPTCAGFCALFNQARASQGLSSIGELGPYIYPLIGSANFRDIVSGSNSTTLSRGLYSATAGYDEATGIGAPLALTLAETITGSASFDLFIGAALGGGWYYSPWFGDYNNTYYPWLYRSDLGFIYVDSAAPSLYLYVVNGSPGSLGWLYTTSSLFPNVYSFSRGSWLYFGGGTDFYNYNRSTWETY